MRRTQFELQMFMAPFKRGMKNHTNRKKKHSNQHKNVHVNKQMIEKHMKQKVRSLDRRNLVITRLLQNDDKNFVGQNILNFG